MPGSFAWRRSRLWHSVVLDVGAGTGIATRQLVERGAYVFAVDRGRVVLGRAVAHTAGLAATVADGTAPPIRTGAADLVCYAQASHWLDQEAGPAEAHRVLRAGGRWAAWWSHACADGEEWFDAYFSLIERSCLGTHRGQRDTNWGAAAAASPLFDAGDRVAIPWTREIAVEDWMTDQVSHSYVVALAEADRRHLVDGVRRIVEGDHPTKTTLSPRLRLRLPTQAGQPNRSRPSAMNHPAPPRRDHRHP